MTVELDERAVAKAAMAVGDALWRHVAQNPETIARAAITAYLDAAAAERGDLDKTGWDAIESGSVERAEWEDAQRNGYVWDEDRKAVTR